ncbi:MAG: dTDP-4-dehydrorhamnose 3,5-epimerase [Gemmataceae bacterium]|nr:dTDP-4-dehydrorhamnose 3,5-epimerase [Gemmataceae bacterium]
MEYQAGTIEGVIWKSLSLYKDPRGWLCELFRHDELPKEFHPVMAYISMTEPGTARGPHEHIDQADCFGFIGPSNFKVYLWDARKGSATFGKKQVEIAGVDNPRLLVVPPGVVHAYKNAGKEQGLVFNCPNRLYKGWGKKDPVDEIRHEEMEGSPFLLD